MTINEALEYINAATWSQWKLGLTRTFELLSKVGDPQNKLRFVHIAGTNGKGSTCAMLESILRAAGFKTGMYPSPFIEDFCERIQVNATNIPVEELCHLTEKVKAAADTMDDHPSQFELITAIGMLYFAEQECDIVVLETGLGGTFDSTNVIDAPEVAVITNIGYDHTEYLGNTLAEIASAKAGIIKAGSSVVAYPSGQEALDVIKARCEEEGCPLEVVDFGRMKLLASDILSGHHLIWKKAVPFGEEKASEGLEFYLSLSGEYQIYNAATVLTTIEAMRRLGWNIPDEAIKTGMSNVKWPARFEVLRKDPLFILDGGHNLQCAKAVADSLQEYLPGTKLTMLIGILADKDYMSVLDTLLPFADKCYCVTPPSPRALGANDLAEFIREKGMDAVVFNSIPEAVEAALTCEGPVLAFGSLYMAGEVRTEVRKRCGIN